MRILIIEDDTRTSEYVARNLTEHGHVVDCEGDGPEGLKRAMVEPYDVLIVDRMVPGLDGLSITKTLRKADIGCPILFVTAMDGIEDKIEGLVSGADDYLVKPFAIGELVARVHALGRRRQMKGDQVTLKIADLEMNLITRMVTRGGVAIELQPREAKLLEVLLRNAGLVLTRSMLLMKVWNFNFDPGTTVVETHISRLRAKIDRPEEPSLIKTIRRAGYKIDVD